MAPRAFAKLDGAERLLIGDERRGEHENLLPEMKMRPRTGIQGRLLSGTD